MYAEKTVREAVTLSDADEPYRFDVQAPRPKPVDRVTLQGRLTVNGRPLQEVVGVPDASDSGDVELGSLTFACVGGYCSRRSVTLTAASFRKRIEPGRYRVTYAPARPFSDTCPAIAKGSIAGRTYVVDPELVVTSGGRRDFDMKALRVEGRVTVEGESPRSAERGSGSANPESVGSVSMKHYWNGLDGGAAGRMCSTWTPAVSQRLTVGSEASTWQFWAFPGHYRIRTMLDRGGGRVERAVELADEGVEFQRDLPMTEVAGRIVREGEPLDEQEIRDRWVIASTARGQVELPVAADGTFSGRVIGRGPQIVYEHRNDFGTKPGERPAPDGSVVVREGCWR
jgi:hypothetical protein